MSPQLPSPPAALPAGSRILVTGATGYVASHVVSQLLARGYRVRGTVRDLQAAAWLNDVFADAAHRGDLELVQVPDFAAPDAFKEAVKGVAGVTHIATISTWDPNPHNVVPQNVAGSVSILRAAANEPSVKSVVCTSSAVAAYMPVPGVEAHVGKDSWNDVAVQMAWAAVEEKTVDGVTTVSGGNPILTVLASKVEAEKAVWKFVEEEKPHFVVNVVNPYTIMGEMLHKSHLRGTAGWIEQLYRGDSSLIAGVPTTVYINVKDVALLHVAALLDPDVKQERIHAWASSFNWYDALDIIRKLYPNHEVASDLPGLTHDRIIATVDDALARQLLRKWGGQEGYIGLEQTIDENLKSAL